MSTRLVLCILAVQVGRTFSLKSFAPENCTDGELIIIIFFKQ